MRTEESHQNILLNDITEKIASLCKRLKGKTPIVIWKAVCAELLATYPPVHPAWGHASDMLRNFSDDESTTYQLIKISSNATIKSWKEIDKTTYYIAKISSDFEEYPSLISEALRDLSNLCNAKDAKIKAGGICRLCWRLATSERKGKRILKINETHKKQLYLNSDSFIELYKSLVPSVDFSSFKFVKKFDKYYSLSSTLLLCDKHKNGSKDYQRSYKVLPETTMLLYAMNHTKHDQTYNDIINSVFPVTYPHKYNPSTEDIELLKKYFPNAFSYLSSKCGDIKEIKHIVTALVSDSSDNSFQKETIDSEIAKMLKNPGTIYGHLVNCEAWQAIFNNHRPGGYQENAGRKSKLHHLTDEDRAMLFSYFKKGLSKQEIAQRFNLSRATVYRIYKQYRDQHSC